MKTDHLKARIYDILFNGGVKASIITEVVNLMGVPGAPVDIPIPRETRVASTKPALNNHSVRAAKIDVRPRSHSITRFRDYDMITWAGFTYNPEFVYRMIKVGGRREPDHTFLLGTSKTQDITSELIKAWIIQGGVELFIKEFPYGTVMPLNTLTRVHSKGIQDSDEVQLVTSLYGNMVTLIQPSKP